MGPYDKKVVGVFVRFRAPAAKMKKKNIDTYTAILLATRKEQYSWDMMP
jgi:hypothetical protein